MVEGQNPYARKHDWFASTPSTQVQENSDRWAVEHGRISLTALRLDLTDEKWLQMDHQQTA
jgi:5'-nucleotidase